MAVCSRRKSCKTRARARQIHPMMASLLSSASAKTYFSATAATTKPANIRTKKWGAWMVESNNPTTAVTRTKLKNKGKPLTRKNLSRLKAGAPPSGARKGKLTEEIKNTARSEAVPATANSILKLKKWNITSPAHGPRANARRPNQETAWFPSVRWLDSQVSTISVLRKTISARLKKHPTNKQETTVNMM